jgi:hypothetical protein
MLSLLKRLVTESSRSMLFLFVERIKETLDVLPDLSIQIAERFFDCIRPIILMNGRGFYDHLMLVFRKLSFSRYSPMTLIAIKISLFHIT